MREDQRSPEESAEAAQLRRERTLRRSAELAEQRARFLADAGRELAAILDESALATHAAQLAVPEFGSLAFLDRAHERMRCAAASSVHDDLVAALRARGPAPGGAIERVMASGQAEVLLELDAATRDQLAAGAGEIIERLGLTTAIVLPLVCRSGVLGTLTLLAPDLEHSCAAQLTHAEAFAERVALALEAASRIAAAEQSNRSKTDFIAVLSHEFRTPLTSIVGYAELLLTGAAGELSAVQENHIARLRAAAWHLTQLVEDILVFARGDRAVALQHVAVQLAPFLEEVVGNLQPVAARSGIGLHMELPAADITIHTDPGKLRQILINLIGNALKFTQQGEVRVTAHVEGTQLIFRITDTGIGVPDDMRDRIFEPFVRGEQDAVHVATGTGLGLTVSRELARRLGGDVLVQSAEGRGSVFSVVLPLS